MKTYAIIFSFLLLNSCVQPSAPIPLSLPDSFNGTSSTDFLIYGGPGSWRAEIESLKKILYSNGATYEVLSLAEINNLSAESYSKYAAILFAGGDAKTVRKSLTQEARLRIKKAVQTHGLNYLGFCAGAWLAVAPVTPNSENSIYGLGVVEGPLLEFNYLSKMGRKHDLDKALFPDGTQRKLLWYGGPITPDTEGAVVAKYSDGTAAISQIRSGKGLVIISGLHPAARKSTLTFLNLFDSEAVAPDLAWTLLDAAMRGKLLPTF